MIATRIYSNCRTCGFHKIGIPELAKTRMWACGRQQHNDPERLEHGTRV